MLMRRGFVGAYTYVCRRFMLRCSYSHTYMHVFIRTHIHTCMYLYTHIYIHACIHTHRRILQVRSTCVCVCVCTYTHRHVCVCVCVRECACVCVCVCLYEYIYVMYACVGSVNLKKSIFKPLVAVGDTEMEEEWAVFYFFIFLSSHSFVCNHEIKNYFRPTKSYLYTPSLGFVFQMHFFSDELCGRYLLIYLLICMYVYTHMCGRYILTYLLTVCTELCGRYILICKYYSVHTGSQKRRRRSRCAMTSKPPRPRPQTTRMTTLLRSRSKLI